MKAKRRFGLLAAMLFTTIAALLSLRATAADYRVELPGHVVQALADRQAVRPAAKADFADSTPISLTVVLRRSDPEGFDRHLAELYAELPSNRRYASPTEISDRFGPHAADYDAVRAFFVAHGFELLADSPNRMTIGVRAPRGYVANALGVTIRDFTLDERRIVANENNPSLPADIAKHVHAIIGLSNVATPAVVSRPLAQAAESQRGCVGGDLTTGVGVNYGCAIAHVLLVWAANIGCFVSWGNGCKMLTPFQAPPSDRAPGASPPSAVDHGSGQKIGIVAFDSFKFSDVADFLALVGLPPQQINQLTLVPVNGGAPIGADEREVLLDIDIAMVIARNAIVAVYSAPFSGAGSFQAIFNSMINTGVTVISNSWAYCENQTSAADVQSIDAILATAAASGISTFNASGDHGSTCLNGAPNTVHVPASSPHALAVGGTSLTPGLAGLYGSETWWNGSGHTPPTGQGGYGVSRFFARPSYQNGHTSSPTRSVPDIAINADPAANGLVICQASAGGCPTPLLYGGTSAAAPVMAAFTAVLNEARGTNLGWPNPALYALAGTNAFHSAASMGSDFAHVGLGSPNMSFINLGLKGAVPGTPNAGQSIVEAVQATNPADGTTPIHVVVQLRDANGASVPGKTVTLAKSAGSSALITPASGVSTVANGTVVFSVTNPAVENVVFTATDVTDGVVITQTTAVQFVVPPAAAGGINAFPTTVVNNGVATTTITVSLQDANGNPSPGKLVSLSQGGGRSIISAPSPSITNASGQIQFTATNKIAETVTYTAVDITDGDLPVPGSAVVTFSGQASVSCAGAIAAAPGFAVTSFATGFIAEAFPFSNVNWGCAGASDPTFDPLGGFYIASFRTGELFKLPPQGGAASTANRISTPGVTLQRAVFGKDGSLYVARAATGSGFFSGQVLELDPQTGATLRTLVTNLPCVTPLAVDPLSGDLFFTGQCFGAGSDDARLLRISNPGGPTPVLSTYATLPGTPNGVVSFAPDGTIFVAITYLAATPPVVRISGTNQPQPPTITPVPGINSVFWVNVGETLPGGAAKSLIVNTSDQKLKLANITTDPPTFTELLTTGASSGVVGPDGCLYISNGETVFKLTSAIGACGFSPTTAAPAISLSPAIAIPDPAQGTAITLTATLLGVPAAADIPVMFRIAGANGQPKLVRTDATGKATLTYIGKFTGQDAITAEAVVGMVALDSNTARVNWVAGKHATYVTLNVAPEGGIVGTPVTLSAALVDTSVNPQVGIAGVTLQFNVGGQSCNALTNASGIASCAVTIPLTGNYTLTVTYAGNAVFLADTDSIAFDVLAAGPPPCFAFNDVDSTSVFCANVEWIRNRAVTLGCAVSLYCPNDDVFRLNMAAFMNRLGTALTPTVFFNALEPGAIDPDAQPVVCQTSDFATGVFTRRAIVDASFSGRSTAGVGFAADAVASFDGGATWTPLAAFGNRAYAGANQWGHVRARGIAELDASQTVRFGLWISRGGLAGSADLTDSRCKLRAAIGSR